MTTPTPLWTDDERPWVNEYMNASSKLGMAARIISRWGKDWHKDDKDVLQYMSAHNDIADMADVITSLLIERDDYEADRAELEAMRDTRGGWEPIQGPVFVEVGHTLFRFTAGRCELVGGDSGEDYPNGYRLCRRVESPALDAPDGLEYVLNNVAAWQERQFPHRTAHSIATHLLGEAGELHREPTDAEEMADVMMLLWALARYCNVDLAEAVRAKLIKNQARTWGKPDADGVVRHLHEAKEG